MHCFVSELRYPSEGWGGWCEAVATIRLRREGNGLMKLEFEFSPRNLRKRMPDPEVAAALGDRLWSRSVVYGSELAERFFAATHKVPCTVRVAWTFTKKELDAARHLVLVARMTTRTGSSPASAREPAGT